MESTSMIQQTRNWLELPADVMSMILLKLGVIEILTNAQYVCSYWRKICKDPLMWRVIDMHNRFDRYDTPENLRIMCKTAVDRSCGLLIDINIDYFGTDELLQHITHSSNQLTRLRIAYCLHISDKMLSEAVSNLTLLEHLEIWSSLYFVETLKTVGQCCPLLKSLKLNREFPRGAGCDNEAVAIAETMPKLHHLQILGNELTNMGLQVILDGCPELESLDLRRCFKLDLAGQLKKHAEKIKNLQLPYDDLDPDIVFCETDYDYYADHSFGINGYADVFFGINRYADGFFGINRYEDYDDADYDSEDDYSFGFSGWY